MTPALYLSPTELIEASTGVDWGSIPVRGATPAQQLAEQKAIIRRATRWVDGETRQKLQATSDRTLPLPIGYDRAKWNADGSLALRLDYFPVVTVNTIELTIDGQTWNEVSPPWAILQESQQMIRVLPSSGVAILGNPNTFSNGWVRVSYVDGYPNMLLTVNASAAATSLTVDDRTGLLAGSIVTIFDGEFEEDVTVASSYTAATGAGAVALAAATTYAHLAGVRVSALPDDVREATLLVATSLARQRGRGAIEVNSTGGGRMSRAAGGVRVDDYARAREYLRPYRKWG